MTTMMLNIAAENFAHILVARLVTYLSTRTRDWAPTHEELMEALATPAPAPAPAPPRRRRAMTHEHASQVNREGHAEEHMFAHVLGPDAEVKSGTSKPDVRQGAEFYSVKKHGIKIQWGLHGHKFLTAIPIPLTRLLVDCIDVYPATFNAYVQDKKTTYALLAPRMVALKEHLHDKTAMGEFLSLFMRGRNKEVTRLAMANNSRYAVFCIDEIVQLLVSTLVAENSKARHKGQNDHQKVVLKAPKSRGSPVSVFEIEMRHDSNTHYRELLVTSLRDPFFTFMISRLQLTSTRGVIDYYGTTKA